MGIRVLCLGEIVGKAGVFCIKTMLPKIKQEKQIDFVIADGEGATGGFGIGKNHSIYLHKLGIDVLTSGEKIYYKRDMVEHIKKAPYLLRPANYPPGNPGRGWRIYPNGDRKIAVINLLGQSGFSRVHLSNPYTFVPEIVNRIKEETPIIILDYHAATTAEKYTMFYTVDGLVSAVAGTHTKALTADEKIMKNGTGVICDTGRVGSVESVGGLRPDVEIHKFLTMVPERSQECWERMEVQGVVFDIGLDGKTESVERVRVACNEEYNDGNSDSNED
ncbi:MAG: YmdB family metallophosphoesterase [Spirochaetales bacterium]|nr:YmdB family metallophosphoesterase [Spirochaetales bacterium]